MKKQFYHFQKKYSFFQKSFFDFFSWRSQNFFQKTKSSNFQSFQKDSSGRFAQKFSPFEQENIGLLKYSRTFEKKREQKTFENFQKFHPFFKKNKSFSNSPNSWKKISLDSTKKIHFQFFKHKKKRKLSKFFFQNSILMPKRSSFEIFRNVHVFGPNVVGNFFPKQKNFQQYWVFPFLGILFFFSQNSSITFSKNPLFVQNTKASFRSVEKERFHNFFQSWFLAPIEPLKEISAQKKFSEQQGSFEAFSEVRKLPRSRKSNGQFFPENQSKKLNGKSENEKSNFEVSFSAKDSKKLSQSFRTSEKKEIEEFLKFSTKIFQNSIQVFSFEQKNDFFPKSQIFLQNLRLQKDFQQRIQNKRHSFAWIFYSFDFKDFFFLSENETFPKKGKFFSDSKTHIFSDHFSEKTKNLSTPLFEFSKNLSLLDDYGRKSSLFPHIFLQNEDFLFLNSFFSNFGKQEQGKQICFQKNESFPVQRQKNLFLQEKTFFFLKNWAKTQKFWNFQPLFLEPLSSSNESFQKISEKANSKKKQIGLHFQQADPTQGKFFPSVLSKPSVLEKSETIEKKISFFQKNTFHLDELFLKKFFEKFQENQYQKSSGNFVNDLIRDENFSFKKSKQPRKEELFAEFKKQTFDFFLFDHYFSKQKKFVHENFEKTLPSRLFSFEKIPNSQKRIEIFLDKEKMQNNLLESSNNRSLSLLKRFSRISKRTAKSFFSPVESKFFRFHSKLKNQPFLFLQPILLDASNLKLEKSVLSNSQHQLDDSLKGNLRIFPKNFASFAPKTALFSSSNVFDLSKNNTKHNFQNSIEKFQKQQVAEAMKSSFSFSMSNGTFFEKFSENLSNLFFKSFVSNLHSFSNFQKSFLAEAAAFSETRETTQFLKPLVFQKNQVPFQKSKIVFSLRSKKDLNASLFGFEKKRKKNNLKKEFFSNFGETPRKFEKVFQTFFSPLNTKNQHFSFHFRSFAQKSKKIQKNSLFFKSFSNVLKEYKQRPRFSLFLFQKDKNSKTKISPFASQAFTISEQGEKNKILKKVWTLSNESSRFFSNHFKIPQTQIDISKTGRSQKKNRLSPERVLKKDGFVFLCFQGEGRLLSSFKQKKTFVRFEKEKVLQKKRRLKKEKLETRRRKKRKRFFPRPTWLRMNMYKKFLKTRHSEKFVSSFSFGSSEQKNLRQKNSFFFFCPTSQTKKMLNFSFCLKKKSEEKKLKKYLEKTRSFVPVFGFVSSPSVDGFLFKRANTNGSNVQQKVFEKSSDFQKSTLGSRFLQTQTKTFLKKTYRKNIQKWGFYWKKGFHEKMHSKKFFKNLSPQEFFGFENSGLEKNLFSPFLQETNERIQLPFSEQKKQRIVSKNIEHYKISGDVFRDFLRFSWKSSWFQANFQPYTKKIQESFQKMQFLEAEKNISSSMFFPVSNIKKFLFFVQTLPERGLFSFRECFFQSFRCHNESEIFGRVVSPKQSFLSSENVDKSISSKFLWYSNIRNSMSLNSIEKREMNFVQKLKNTTNIPEYNRILYARISEVLRNFKFSENTSNDFFFQQLQVQKRKNEKIFSGTKNSFFTKSALFFEKFQVPSQPILPAFSVFSSLFQDSSIKPTGDVPTLRALWAFQKTNGFHFQEINSFRNIWTLKKRKDMFKALKGTKQLNTFFRKYNGFETFDGNWRNKLSLHSLGTRDQGTSKLSHMKTMSSSFLFEKKSEFFDHVDHFDTRTLKKFQNVEKKASLLGIQSFEQNSKLSFRYFKYHLSELSQKIEQKRIRENSKFFKNKNKQDSAKSSLNFWWAQKPHQEFDFFETPFGQYDGKIRKNFSFLFVGALFFQFALFSSFLKIPEIRSVFKFQFLIFSKLWKTFFLIFFSLSNLFKKYTKNFQHIFENSTNVFLPKKFFSGAFQEESSLIEKSFFEENSFFSRKKYIFEYEFENSNGPSLSFPKFELSTFSENRMNFWAGKGRFMSAKKRNFSPFEQSQSFSEKFVFEFFPRFSWETKKKSTDVFKFNQKKTLFSSVRSTNSAFVFQNEKNFLTSFDRDNAKIQRLKNFVLFSETLFGISQQFQKPSFCVPFRTFKNEKIFENLSATEKNISVFTLSFLFFGRSILLIPSRLFKIGSAFSIKIFEIVEAFFFAIYKFLEKPAEFMVEFIAFVFLLEWSSDVVSFLPDSFESFLWKSSQKLCRPLRLGTFVLHGGILQTLPPVYGSMQKLSFFGPLQFLSVAGIATSANFTAFVLQKRFFYVFENFPSILFQPDIDILVRQKKGMIFWDIWAEILFKAAEKYNVNIPSFVTLKEEQEIFLEKLVRDSDFFQSFQSENVSLFSRLAPQIGRALPFLSAKHDNLEKNSFQNFSSFLQNFVLQYSPSKFFDPFFVATPASMKILLSQNFQKKFQQALLSELFRETGSSKYDLKFQKLQNKKTFSISSFDGAEKEKNFETIFPFFENFLFAGEFSHLFHNFMKQQQVGQKTLLMQINPNFEDLEIFSNIKNTNRWEANQYATFQSQETDFFFDIHLPKSLKHVHFLKYSEPAHFPLGSLICQIYSGLFPKQVSKNILVIGESGTAKTLFLQALAGETEMKIMIENASRYAIVQRGVAVGMKFLRDVFDAIALQTPCFFVMEDLHIIGSKRPFLISENETGKGNLSAFGLEQLEVHETNQMIYQSSRHSIFDFRRPYKGDFSMGIPTNFFLQTFSSSFFSSSRNRSKSSLFVSNEIEKNSVFSSLRNSHTFQNSQFFGGNFSSKIQNFLSSPLPFDSFDQSRGGLDQNQGIQDHENSNFSMFFDRTRRKNLQKIQSCLQFSKEQVFAPPATSPFTVLLMKEQKKFKPKKIVQETSWGGLSVDQILSYQKESSSVRAKVAVFAEKTLNLSRGKFDMITDFLVLLDSVRSNRGFVVFGTTHKPSVLDPALRRPGRFDETLSLSVQPNFLNRFEIFQMNFENSVSTFDFLDASLFTENFSETDIFQLLVETKLSLFHQYKYGIKKYSRSLLLPYVSQAKDGNQARESSFRSLGLHEEILSRRSSCQKPYIFMKKRLLSKMSPTNAFWTNLKSFFFEDFYTQKQFLQLQLPSSQNSNFSFSSIFPKGPSHLLNRAYSKIGIFLAESNFVKNPKFFMQLSLDLSKDSFENSNFQQFFGNIFYDSQHIQHLQLSVFFAGKIAEFLLEKQNLLAKSFSGQETKPKTSFLIQKNENIFEKPLSFFETKFAFFAFSSFQIDSVRKKSSSRKSNAEKSFENSTTEKNFQKFVWTKMNLRSIHHSEFNESLVVQKNFSWTAFGDDETWRIATPFVFSFVRKRFLFTKNLFLSKMLFFENSNQRRQPPSPPASSIFMPAKKYENFKRTENDFFQKGRFSMNQKIQMHQKQRFLKQLYNIPIQQNFRSEIRKNQLTNLSTSFQEIAYLDSFAQNATSTFVFQRKYVQIRHRFSHINQWWNGMFPEHTRESTYLSDVDWRTMFFSGKKGIHTQKASNQNLDRGVISPDLNDENEKKTVEFLMDFPDCDQYYNPRNRRWFFNVSSKKESLENSTFWALFEKDLQYEIFYHFLLESFQENFSYFDKQREMLDFFVYNLLQKGVLKEFHFLITFSRF
jgi:SpoVK/Ycf46/Vps4 family AAA+-type ATPase